MFDGLMNEPKQDTLSSLLERAMHLIEDKKHWCQRTYWRTSGGEWQYCALGAVEREARLVHGDGAEADVRFGLPFMGPLGLRAQIALHAAAARIGHIPSAAWVNDTLGHRAVIHMYRLAIATAKAQGD